MSTQLFKIFRNHEMPFDPKKLKAIREKKGVDLAAFGEGLPYFTVRAIELGLRPNPKINTVEKIAARLGVSIEALMGPSEPKRKGR